MRYIWLNHLCASIFITLQISPDVFVTGDVWSLTFSGGPIKSLVANIHFDLVACDISVGWLFELMGRLAHELNAEANVLRQHKKWWLSLKGICFLIIYGVGILYVIDLNQLTCYFYGKSNVISANTAD